MPSPNHAGGLRYHGMNPIISKLKHEGYRDVIAYEQTKVFQAAKFLCKSEELPRLSLTTLSALPLMRPLNAVKLERKGNSVRTHRNWIF